MQVTTGIFRLEELVYRLSADFVSGAVPLKGAGALSGLLVRPAGSQHTLGLLLLSQFFKRHGWHVFSANQFTEDDMVVAVQTEWVDLLGISLSEDKQISQAKQWIARLRQQAGNPDLQVMVGADFACLRADQAQTTARERVLRARKPLGE